MRSYTPYFFFFYRTTFLLYIIFVFFFSFLTVRHLQISKGKGKMNRLNNNRRIIIRYLLPNCPKKNERTVLLKWTMQVLLIRPILVRWRIYETERSKRLKFEKRKYVPEIIIIFLCHRFIVPLLIDLLLLFFTEMANR